MHVGLPGKIRVSPGPVPRKTSRGVGASAHEEKGARVTQPLSKIFRFGVSRSGSCVHTFAGSPTNSSPSEMNKQVANAFSLAYRLAPSPVFD